MYYAYLKDLNAFFPSLKKKMNESETFNLKNWKINLKKTGWMSIERHKQKQHTILIKNHVHLLWQWVKVLTFNHQRLNWFTRGDW